MPWAKGEAGEHPALCPQLWSQLEAGRSQIPALARRPFPRPGPALGRGPTASGRRVPSLR